MGLIVGYDKMPSAKITNPRNGDKIPANQEFNLSVAVVNLAAGNFVNPNKKYYAAPQQIEGDVILGHCHIVCQNITSPNSTMPLDTRKFAFFKVGVDANYFLFSDFSLLQGLNEAEVNGTLSTTVTNGLPAGHYRCCTMMSAANHQPPLMPVAQRGTVDDCTYVSTLSAIFTISDLWNPSSDGSSWQRHRRH